MEGPPLMTNAPMLSRESGSLFLRPHPQHPVAGLLHWWDGGGDPPGMDGELHQIMNGSYPLLTAEGRDAMDRVCNTLSSEFKHPGRLGVNGRGSNGGGAGSGGRKKRCKPRELTSPLTLRAVNQKMLSFVQDQSGEAGELKFNLVSRALCKTIAALAHVYQLDYFIEQKRRLPVASPVLRKTSLTRLASKEEIEPILRRHGQDGFITALLVTKDGSSSTSRSKSSQDSPMSHSHSHSGGVVLVGGGCDALDEGNLGNRMLQGMGWRPGSGLGPESSGITSPIRAYLRMKRAGLGFS